MRQLLVFGAKTFKIEIPDDAKITFGPFSPPPSGGYRNAGYGNERAVGTLRIYQKTKENIIAVFSGVHGFRDLSLNYMEEVAKEEGATIWKSDHEGYMREEKVTGSREWVKPEVPEISPAPDGEVPF